MENTERTSSLIENSNLNAGLTGASAYIDGVLSGDGFILVGYQPPNQLPHARRLPLQISKGELTL